ncbi:heavy-metal-associated domain-containing protein [Mycolicibacterium arseniciresistens]|uniref:Heavy-metal-associated domain-containing protein n=1 Tax=Mycolicibacterium arseniciresistens TaxID=3062257 RepID=A0ABT8UBN3_9MYCO|nr:heavy-metal-associated domain-containing protein [Mycolicibacterium arseniciresistens]MDO3634586.1 heavy-metal-associated domain-containing protein [Mycolicibacterium arseniciresistens]
MSTVTLTVTGMTCGHCAASVREEVSSIDGVTGVDVDVSSGRLTIDSVRELDAQVIRNAVEEAGYQLAG